MFKVLNFSFCTFRNCDVTCGMVRY